MKKTKWQYKMILRYARRHTKDFVMGELCIIASKALAVSLPFVLALFVDQVLVAQDASKLVFFAVVFVSILVGNCFFLYVYPYFWNNLTNGFVYDLRRDAFNKAIYAKSCYLTSINSGDLIERIHNDTFSMLRIVQRNFLHAIVSIISIVFVLVVLCFVNIWVALIVLLSVVAPVLLNKLFAKHLSKLGADVRNKQGNYLGWLNQILTGVMFVRLFYRRQDIEGDYKYKQKLVIDAQYKASISTFVVGSLADFVALLSTIGLYFLTYYLIRYSDFTIGLFVAVIQYLAIMKMDLNYILSNYAELAIRKANIGKVHEILNLDTEDEDVNNIDFEITKGDIVFDGVSFGYDGKRDILKNISLKIEGGTIVGIVGESGSGKSTISELLLNFYDLDCGSVCVDSQDISKIRYKSLRRQVSLLQQESMIFDGTIEYNLKIGNPSATLAQLDMAIQKASLTDFIKSLPAGLQTQVDNASISGGEKQRLALARMYLRDPKIVIYDEPTSALDYENEDIIMKSVKQSKGDKTAIIVSHRLNTIKNCDKIFLLKDKSIVESGTFDWLSQNSAYFKDLFFLQATQVEK